MSHPEDARGEALGPELLQTIQRLTGAQELDGDARHGLHGERRSATGIAVELGEDEAIEGESVRERLGDVHRVAAHQRVAHQDGVGGRYRAIDCLELLHELVVHGEATGRVVHDGVEALLGRASGGGGADLDGGLTLLAGVDGHVEALAELLELEDRGGPVDVGGDQQRPSAVLRQRSRQLASGRGLSHALQAHEHDAGDAAPARELGVDGPHQGHELLLADLDEVLTGGRAPLASPGVPHPCLHPLADRPLLDACEEIPNHREIDIRLEQRHAHVAQRFRDVLVGQLTNAGQLLPSGCEAPGQGLEHGGGE